CSRAQTFSDTRSNSGAIGIMALQNIRCKMQSFNNSLAREVGAASEFVDRQTLGCHLDAVADKLPCPLKRRLSMTNPRVSNNVLPEFSRLLSFFRHRTHCSFE